MKCGLSGHLEVEKRKEGEKEIEKTKNLPKQQGRMQMLSKRFMCSSPEKQSLKKHRIFPNIYLKGWRGPPTDGLDEVRWNAIFGK
jgi:hypothetical protein